MLLSKLIPLYVALKGLLFPFHQDLKHNDFDKSCHYKIKKVARLDERINESSGLQYLNDSTILNINDSGCTPTLFVHDQKGCVRKEVVLPIKNHDWEDLTQDDKGNIYIGDFGNNANKRKDLVIYKLDKKYNLIGRIQYSYEDQKRFPPSEENLNYDCEGFFHYEGTLYLFSKNRGNKTVKLYALPDSPGKHIALLQDSTFLNGPITAAAISPNQKEFTLLSYGQIYSFSTEHKVNFKSPKWCFYFGRAAQSEGITYMNESDFLISNEQGKLFVARKK